MTEGNTVEVKTDSQLLVLAERCEKATGPDRELDLAIAIALNVHDVFDRAFEWRWSLDGGEIAGWRDGKRKPCAYLDPAQFVHRVTASLDAAMELIPDNLHLAQFGEARFMTRSPCFSASLEQWVDEHLEARTPFRCHGVALTPALAICAAALCARATA